MNNKHTVVLILTLTVILSGCTAADAEKNAGPVEWMCSQYTCETEQTGVEWANENCEVTEQGTLCPVTVDGEEVLIPAEQLSLNNITVCQEFRCQQETPFRSVNYTTTNMTPSAQNQDTTQTDASIQ